MSSPPSLVLLPSLQATQQRDGRLGITKKFLDGVLEYQRFWDGPVRVLIEVSPNQGNNLDNVEVRPNELPFSLEVTRFDALDAALPTLAGAVVLASASHRQNHVAALCRRHGVPCVYTTEYSLKTVCQIIDTGTRNPLLRLRRKWWARRQERRQANAISITPGVQCNGTPTFEAYRKLTPNPLLYFDTRVTEAMLLGNAELESRLAPCLSGAPLRLLFSGRLIAMKGADHLIDVARHLRDMSVPFVLSICGDGDQAPGMRRRIQELGLHDHVKMLGVLDFSSELVPRVKKETDLFVCCHRQGDPSCTYLETMSCGVPIAGYDNEAFDGVVATSGCGWKAPLNDPAALARAVARVATHRELLAEASRKALEFSSRHTFEATFGRRLEHLRSILSAR